MPASAGEALQAARARLASTSQFPRRDAELILAHVLGWDSTALLTHPERLLSAQEAEQFESLLTRRLAHEPVQYLTGMQEFFGLLFEVSPDVLIPRPETEHLVEAILERFERDANPSIVDVGTGSGAIAVAIAHALPRSRVTAADLSPPALEIARRNAERHGVIDRVTFLQSDLLAAAGSEEFDVVVSNPPYIANEEVLEPQVANYEPRSALYAGPTGLEIYERLIPQAREVLKPGGWLMMEIGYGQEAALRGLLGGWSEVSFVPDLQGIARVVLALQPKKRTFPGKVRGSTDLSWKRFSTELVDNRYSEEPMATISELPKTSLTFEQKLDRLAQVAVNVGLGLARGQELVMTAGLDSLPLARLITEQAYKAGASLVTTLYTDEPSTLLRYRHADDAGFDTAAGWLFEGMAQAFRSGAARLAITGGNPSLLSKEDPEKVGRANRAVSKAYRPAIELITRHDINWTIVASATPAWAQAVFPDLPPDQAMTKLWDAIFAASRLDVDDPIARWKEHDSGLHRRADLMNQKRYAALHFRGPGTDLRVGLADDHLWMGGGTQAGTGAYCIPNMPTEEVFTTPHKDRVEGTVTSTKPLSHQGTMIEKIAVRFEGGRVVDAKASRGQEVLQRMIDTDDGARRLGEVALVPHSSPIASSGLLFLNTLFDENAASHIALGQAYSTCVKNGDQLSPEELAARGANDSLIHVDWMIGSSEIDLDGITATGTAEPLMRKGEWV